MHLSLSEDCVDVVIRRHDGGELKSRSIEIFRRSQVGCREEVVNTRKGKYEFTRCSSRARYGKVDGPLCRRWCELRGP